MNEGLADIDGLVRLWSFTGQAGRAEQFKEGYEVDSPMLVDNDSSLRQAYFVPNGPGAFASNPRHYIIDAEGNLVYMGFQNDPETEIEVVLELLR